MNIFKLLLLLLGIAIVVCQIQNQNSKVTTVNQFQPIAQTSNELKQKQIETQPTPELDQKQKGKVYINFRNKKLLVSSSLKFKPKVIKYYQSYDPIKQSRFYCQKPFKKSNQKLTTSIVKIQQGQQLVNTQYGLQMVIDAADPLVSKLIKEKGTWEPLFIVLIGHIVNPGNNVINLGSHVGLEAVIMGKIIGPSGRLFIFQPYEVSNRIVNKNVILNGLQNYTTVYKMGASDHKWKATITIQQENTGGSRIQPTELIKNSTHKTFEVQLDSVDALLPAGISLDFALIDVQRMQVPALRGMREIIKRSPNLIIMTEWDYKGKLTRQQYPQASELLNFMVSIGYGIYTYTPSTGKNSCSLGIFTEYESIKAAMTKTSWDIFFIPKNHRILGMF